MFLEKRVPSCPCLTFLLFPLQWHFNQYFPFILHSTSLYFSIIRTHYISWSFSMLALTGFRKSVLTFIPQRPPTWRGCGLWIWRHNHFPLHSFLSCFSVVDHLICPNGLTSDSEEALRLPFKLISHATPAVRAKAQHNISSQAYTIHHVTSLQNYQREKSEFGFNGGEEMTEDGKGNRNAEKSRN